MEGWLCSLLMWTPGYDLIPLCHRAPLKLLKTTSVSHNVALVDTGHCCLFLIQSYIHCRAAVNTHPVQPVCINPAAEEWSPAQTLFLLLM